MELKCAKVRGDLISYKMDYHKSCTKYTDTINALNQTISEMKDKLSTHQETISILSQQKEAHIKLYKTREDKELDKVIKLENKVKVLDNIVYKTDQSVQTMNMLNNKCRTSFAKPEFLKKAQRVNPHLYDIGFYNDNLALMLAPDSEEVIRLEKESRSKLSDLIRPFDYDKLNNLYDLFVPQREKSSEQRYLSERSRLSHINVNNRKSKETFNKQTTLLEKQMNESIPLVKQCQSSLEIFKVKTYVNSIINGVELYKQKIANRTYIGYIDPFIQSTIESNFSPVISSINVGLDQFHRCLNEEMVADLRYFSSLELEVDSLWSQLETQKTQFLNEIDRLSREYYYADHMNAILGVYTELYEVTNLQRDYLELLEKCEGLETELSKSKMIQRPSVLGKPTTFSNSFVRKDFSKLTSVTQTHVSNDFSKPVTAQTLPPNKKSILKNTNVLASGMYKIDTDHNQTRTSQLPQDSRKTNKRMSFSTGVISTTSVSRPQLKSNPQGDRVMHNNSQGKKKEVEDQRRRVKLSKNKSFVTACNDSLNAKTLNVKYVCATCDSCVLNDKHDMCVLNYVAKPIKKIVASESYQKPRNFTRKLYEHVSKTCRWWYSKFTPSGYKWKPMSGKENVNPNISMPLGNASRTANVMDNMTSRRSTVSNTPLLNHKLFSVSQFCDADLEVAFRKSTCFIRDLKGNDLLTGSRSTNLYSTTLQDTICPNLICLMAKAISSQAWLWHHRLSHLNFDTINLLSKNDIVVGLSKLKFVKDHLCSSYELGKAKRKLVQQGLQAQVRVVRTDKGTEFLNQTLHAYFAAEGILHQTFVARTPEQNGIFERRNRTFVEAARTMLSIAKVPLFFWAESRAYRVFNKKTKVIMESIHVNFNELPQMASDQISSDLAPECQTMALEHDSFSPAIQRQANVLLADRTVTTSNELDLLFSLMFDELLNGS
nr:integrase, catalytic region, zinc finger, CCHC-type, peptidase aspartic, catalytic [Tanacetum cinerariifolium]